MSFVFLFYWSQHSLVFQVLVLIFQIELLVKSPQGAQNCCLSIITRDLCISVCLKIHRMGSWCSYHQSPSSEWCSCSTSSPRCPSLFWPIWAAAALLDESLPASPPLWFVSYILGELSDPLWKAHEHSCVWWLLAHRHTNDALPDHHQMAVLFFHRLIGDSFYDLLPACWHKLRWIFCIFDIQLPCDN